VATLKKEGLEPSYVYALHSRLPQILNDAMHEGLLARNTYSRTTSDGQAEASHDQVTRYPDYGAERLPAAGALALLDDAFRQY
jgi:hypothetical protein